MTMSSMGLQIEKLRGIEDYNQWKFILKNVLMHEDLYDCIETEKGNEDPKKNQKALAKICLSVGPSALPHIRNAKTAYEAWNSLQRAYEDKGLCRRLGLLRALFGVRLSEAESMQSYLAKITELGQQLTDIGNAFDDEFLAVIMLSGLTPDFDPLIMALENANTKLTSDMVKSKLLQEQQRRDGKRDEHQELNALAVKKPPKCFRCKKIGHIQKDCPKKAESKPKSTPKAEKSWLTALSVKLQSDIWYVDSGATNHMTNNKEIMQDFQCTKSLEVNVANGEKVKTEGLGSVQVQLKKGLKTISNVYYIPKLSANLLSVSELIRKGFSVIFNEQGCKILDDDEVIATSTCYSGVYQLDTVQNVSSKVRSENAMNSVCEQVQPEELTVHGEDMTALVSVGGSVSHEVWHKRLGHLNSRSMNVMKNGMVKGMNFDNSLFSPCVACIEGKQTRLPFPKKSHSRSTKILGLVHTDVCGPMQVPSYSGSRYFVTFIDDFSRKTFIYFLKKKDEVFEKFKIFKALVENFTNKKIKTLRSDNGGEYINMSFQEYLRSCGIRHETTVPHCSEQNGVAERANRTIMDKTRCMLQDAGLGKQYWAEAANTAVYLKNRSPTKAVMGTTPEEKWTSKKVNVAHLRIFGCIAYAVDENARKLDPRSKRFIFVGYCEESKGYRLIDPSYPRKIHKARHVTFVENMFLCSKIVSHDDNKNTDVKVLDTSVLLSEDSTVQPTKVQLSPKVVSEPTQTVQSELSPQVNTSVGDNLLSDGTRNPRRQTMFSLDGEEDSESADSFSSDVTYLPGRSSFDSEDSEQSSYQDVLEAEYAGLTEIMVEELPTKLEEALSSSEAKHWSDAIEDEYNSFIKNKCWTLVDLPVGHKPVKCKWVFSKKRGLNGELLKYKARLVAKGYTQKYGVDYYETFSPVVRYSSIRILLTLAAQYDMVVEHLDVKTAFLNGDLEESVYMEQPVGYVVKGCEKKVYKLNKAIYGLKQSAKAWNKKINDVLTQKLKFNRLSSEPCVYVYSHDGEIMIIALYVDDIMLFTLKTSQQRNIIKKRLMDEFDMKDLGIAHHVLGMKIEKTADGSFILDQSSYIKKILDKFNMADCKPMKTPMEVGIKLQKENNSKCNFDYRSLIGYLMYLSVCSRPDISHSVSFLSQFNNCYGESHCKAAKRVLRYLKGTVDYCLIFQKGEMNIVGFTDADWGANQLDRRSYTGYLFRIGKSIVSWESRKQRTVALSSTEAEYMAISDSCKEAMFLKTFISECTGIVCKVLMLNDNQSAHKLCNNPVFHARSKHIDIRHHFVKDLVTKKQVELEYLCTNEMLADVLTKPLTAEKHLKFVSQILKC